MPSVHTENKYNFGNDSLKIMRLSLMGKSIIITALFGFSSSFMFLEHALFVSKYCFRYLLSVCSLKGFRNKQVRKSTLKQLVRKVLDLKA